MLRGWMCLGTIAGRKGQVDGGQERGLYKSCGIKVSDKLDEPERRGAGRKEEWLEAME